MDTAKDVGIAVRPILERVAKDTPFKPTELEVLFQIDEHPLETIEDCRDVLRLADMMAEDSFRECSTKVLKARSLWEELSKIEVEAIHDKTSAKLALERVHPSSYRHVCWRFQHYVENDYEEMLNWMRTGRFGACYAGDEYLRLLDSIVSFDRKFTYAEISEIYANIPSSNNPTATRIKAHALAILEACAKDDPIEVEDPYLRELGYYLRLPIESQKKTEALRELLKNAKNLEGVREIRTDVFRTTQGNSELYRIVADREDDFLLEYVRNAKTRDELHDFVCFESDKKHGHHPRARELARQRDHEYSLVEFRKLVGELKGKGCKACYQLYSLMPKSLYKELAEVWFGEVKTLAEAFDLLTWSRYLYAGAVERSVIQIKSFNPSFEVLCHVARGVGDYPDLQKPIVEGLLSESKGDLEKATMLWTHLDEDKSPELRARAFYTVLENLGNSDILAVIEFFKKYCMDKPERRLPVLRMLFALSTSKSTLLLMAKNIFPDGKHEKGWTPDEYVEFLKRLIELSK